MYSKKIVPVKMISLEVIKLELCMIKSKPVTACLVLINFK